MLVLFIIIANICYNVLTFVVMCILVVTTIGYSVAQLDASKKVRTSFISSVN